MLAFLFLVTSAAAQPDVLVLGGLGVRGAAFSYGALLARPSRVARWA